MEAKESQQLGWGFDGGLVRRSIGSSKGDGPALEPDFDGIIRREVGEVEFRAINTEERSFEVVASTDTIDSHGDVVEQTFDLKRYRKNPVVLWLHNSFGFFDGSRAEDFLPIGRAEKIKVEDGKLTAKIFFLEGDGDDSLVEKIWRRVQQKIVRAVSIGFRPGKVTEETDDHGHTFFKLSKNELFEISVVPIPSNPDAVAKSLAIQHKHLRRLAAKTSPENPEENEDMSAEKLENAIQAKAEAEAKVKTLEKELSDGKESHEKALKAEQTKVADLETANKDLSAKLETSKAKSEELSEKVKEQEEELTKFRAAQEKTEEKSIEDDVDAALKAKVAPAKHEEKRGKWLKIRKRSAEEFEEIVDELPDLPHLKSIVKDEGNVDTSLEAAIEECKAS